MSLSSFYKWRSKYGGMDASMMMRMEELEDENRRLKKMYAEEKLKVEIMSEAIQKNGEAISPMRDGINGSPSAWDQHQQRMHDFRDQPDLLIEW